VTVYCHNCGTANEDDAKRCTNCGASLEAASSKPPGQKKFKGTMMMPGMAPGASEHPEPPAAPTSGKPTGDPEGPRPDEPSPGSKEDAAPSEDPSAPKSRGKFKGTMMMPGMQSPVASPPAGGPETPTPPDQDEGEASRGAGLPFQETMMGPMTPPADGSPPPPDDPRAFGDAPTEEEIPRPPGFGPPTVDPGSSPRPWGASADENAATAPGQAAWGSPPDSERTDAPAWGRAPTPDGPGRFGGGPGSFGGTPARTPAGRPPGFGAPGVAGPGAPPATPATAPSRRTWLFIGLGCLALVAIACPIGIAIGLYINAQQIQTDQAGVSAAEMATRTSIALTQIRTSCASDPTGSSVGAAAHPTVREAVGPGLCRIDGALIATVADPTQSDAALLASTGDVSRAASLGLDPSQCVRIRTGDAEVTGCDTAGGHQIIGLRLPPEATEERIPVE